MSMRIFDPPRRPSDLSRRPSAGWGLDDADNGMASGRDRLGPSLRWGDGRVLIASLTLALLAGCGEKTDQSKLAQAESDARAGAANEGRIDCIPAGETALRRICGIERSRDADGSLVLTISHPDGSFRRLMIATDGRGVIAADGAEEAIVKVLNDQEIEVALGGNLYRLPATVKPAG